MKTVCWILFLLSTQLWSCVESEKDSPQKENDHTDSNSETEDDAVDETESDSEEGTFPKEDKATDPSPETETDSAGDTASDAVENTLPKVDDDTDSSSGT